MRLPTGNASLNSSREISHASPSQKNASISKTSRLGEINSSTPISCVKPFQNTNISYREKLTQLSKPQNTILTKTNSSSIKIYFSHTSQLKSGNFKLVDTKSSKSTSRHEKAEPFPLKKFRPLRESFTPSTSPSPPQ